MSEPFNPADSRNITAKRGDPAFKIHPRPDVYRPGVDNPVTAAPVEVIRQLLERFLPIFEPQDVQLPNQAGYDMTILDLDPRFAAQARQRSQILKKLGR